MVVPTPRYSAERFPLRSCWLFNDSRWRQVEDKVEWATLRDPTALLHPMAQRAVFAFYPGPGREQDAPAKAPQARTTRASSAPAAKRPRSNTTALTSHVDNEVWHACREEGSDALRKKVQDREIRWEDIPERDKPLYHDAMENEWSSWIKFRCVRVLSEAESQKVIETTDPRNILGTDWHFRDKNSAFRTPTNKLEVAAKARLTAQGQREKAAMDGLVKLDSPTAQRVSFFVMLQITVSRGWARNTAVADIKCAFLQGKGREEQGFTTKLYLRQPRSKGLPGLTLGQLLEVLKSVYGLPDAARAWFDALVEVLVALGFRQNRLDIAFLSFVGKAGDLIMMVLLHVDDCLCAHDGSDEAKSVLEQLQARFPFGSWQRIDEAPDGVPYTGRRLRLEGEEIRVSMPDFISGRMSMIQVKRDGREPQAPATPLEKCEYLSSVGNIHWVTSQYRWDKAMDANQLQKRQTAPALADLKAANKVTKDLVNTANLEVRIKKIHEHFRRGGVDRQLAVRHVSEQPRHGRREFHHTRLPFAQWRRRP